MLLDKEIVRAQATLRAIGWAGVFEAATASRGTATSSRYNTGGVAVLARDRYTIRKLQVPGPVQGRSILAGLKTASGSKEIVLGSIYLRTGEGGSPANREVLQWTAAGIAFHRGGSVIIGGDFQMDMGQLEATSFHRMIGGIIIPLEGGTPRSIRAGARLTISSQPGGLRKCAATRKSWPSMRHRRIGRSE